MPPTGELALIRDLRRRFRSPSNAAVALGIGDDCALLSPPPNHQIAVTTDLLVEGRHFRRDTHTARSAGHRCLARGLSDLAAMGATPLAAFLSLALPASVITPAGRRWLNGFLAGLHALARRTRTPIAGGDTSESPSGLLHADIVLLGAVPAGQALTRAGAQPGDHLWVSGALGGSAAHLRQILARAHTNPRPSPQRGPQTHPEPRLKLGLALLRRNLRAPKTITACLDLSDGLSSDLRRICEESHLRAQIDAANIPIHPLAARQPDPLTLALSGGEDYELLFAASPSARLPRTLAGVPLTRIGTLLPPRRRSPLVTLRDADAHTAPLAPAGFEHLR